MSQTMANETTPLDTVREVVGKMAVDRVFGNPITQDGLTIIPVASVRGGGGGGRGEGGGEGGEKAAKGPGGQPGMMGKGSGGGLGMMAKPLGVFVVKERNVRWRPAIDVNKVVLGGQIVAGIALLTVRAIAKARAGRRHHMRHKGMGHMMGHKMMGHKGMGHMMGPMGRMGKMGPMGWMTKMGWMGKMSKMGKMSV